MKRNLILCVVLAGLLLATPAEETLTQPSGATCRLVPRRQRLLLEGRAFAARRVNMGMGNCDKRGERT